MSHLAPARLTLAVLFAAIAPTVACRGGTETREPADAGVSDASPPEAVSEAGPADLPAPIDGAVDPGGGPDSPSDDDGAPTDAGADATGPTQLGLYAILAPPTVHLGSVDSSSAMTARSMLPAPDAPQALATSPDGRFVYVLGRQIAAFAVDQAAATLTALNAFDHGLPNWSSLVVDPTQRWLLVGDRVKGITPIGLDDDGRLTEAAAPSDASAPTDDLTFDPSGKHVFAASCASDRVARYTFDPITGALASASTALERTGSGPRRVVFHPSGRTAYVLNAKEQTVSSFEYDPRSGALAAPETASIVATGARPLLDDCTVGHLVVHPSGQFVYATTTESGGSVTIMSVAPTTGRLAVVGHEPYFLFRGADALAVDPTGAFLLVGNTSISLHIFQIGPNDGRLTHVNQSVSGARAIERLAEIDGPRAVARALRSAPPSRATRRTHCR